MRAGRLWRQRCGDPHTVGSPDGKPSGETVQLNFQECPQDADGGPNRPLLAIVGRAYPRAAPGHLTKLRSDPATGKLVVEGVAGSNRAARLVIWVPGRAMPKPKVTGMADVLVLPVTGGHYITARAVTRSYALTLAGR